MLLGLMLQTWEQLAGFLPKVNRMTPLCKEIEQETQPIENAHFCEISCVRQGGQLRTRVKSYNCHFVEPKA